MFDVNSVFFSLRQFPNFLFVWALISNIAQGNITFYPLCYPFSCFISTYREGLHGTFIKKNHVDNVLYYLLGVLIDLFANGIQASLPLCGIMMQPTLNRRRYHPVAMTCYQTP